MKRLLFLICAVLIAVCLCSCMQQAGKDLDRTAETVATEIKENMDNMIDNGTVKDGDGYIDENRQDNTKATEPTVLSNSTDNMDDTRNDEDKGLLNDNTNAAETVDSYI